MLKPYDSVADIKRDHQTRFYEHIEEECALCSWQADFLCDAGREIFRSAYDMSVALEEEQYERS